MEPIDWSKFTEAYIPTFLVWLSLSMSLAIPEYSIGSAFLQSLFLLSWSYWGHRFAHMVSSEYPFNILNPHVYIHHTKSLLMPRWLELLLESLVNFMCFFGLYLVQELLGIHILSSSMILGSAFLYIAIHILDYSMYGNEPHKEHHEKTFCNYNPEVFDTLFNTRCNSKEPYTKNYNEMIHGAGSFSLAYFLKIVFHLD